MLVVESIMIIIRHVKCICGSNGCNCLCVHSLVVVYSGILAFGSISMLECFDSS